MKYNQYSVVTRKPKLTIHVFCFFLLSYNSYVLAREWSAMQWIALRFCSMLLRFIRKLRKWLILFRVNFNSSPFVIGFPIRFHNRINDFLFRIDFFLRRCLCRRCVCLLVNAIEWHMVQKSEHFVFKRRNPLFQGFPIFSAPFSLSL